MHHPQQTSWSFVANFDFGNCFRCNCQMSHQRAIKTDIVNRKVFDEWINKETWSYIRALCKSHRLRRMCDLFGRKTFFGLFNHIFGQNQRGWLIFLIWKPTYPLHVNRVNRPRALLRAQQHTLNFIWGEENSEYSLVEILMIWWAVIILWAPLNMKQMVSNLHILSNIHFLK